MIKKIYLICFIFLTIFLIGTVSAAEIENKTLSSETSNIQINTQDVDMFYNDGTRFKANLSNNQEAIKNASVEFTINGISYNRFSDESGQASISLRLNPGNYNITTKYLEITNNNTIIIKSTIEASDVVKIYKNSTQYWAKFLNKNGDALKNTMITYNINGVFYNRQTNDNGMCKLNINLNQGQYILTAYNPQTDEMKSNLITVLPSITENRDVIKYYRNASKYSAKLLSKDGKTAGSGESARFNINGVFYTRQSDIYGIVSLNLNLEPGKYIITVYYDDCAVSNNITILSTIYTNNLTMSYKDGSKFKVNLVNGQGNPAEDEELTFNINGVFYTRITNENGIGYLNINLNPGKYIITTSHNGLSVGNWIIINKQNDKEIQNTEFSHEIKIPNYVNITYPYVFENSAYTLKSGINGIITMPKNQIFTITIDSNTYLFSSASISGYDTQVIGYKTYLIPFNGSEIQSNMDINKLKGYGIILYDEGDYTHIIYRNNCTNNIEQFGVMISKDLDKSESIHYIQNSNEITKINFKTMNFDEMGLKYSLSKYHGGTIYDFNYKSYEEITKGNSQKIKFLNTNESVTFSLFGNYIVGYLNEEKILTKFNSTNCIDFEKEEIITYGENELYGSEFDVVQSFAIINDKVTNQIIDDWILKETEYKNNVAMKSLYSLFLTVLNNVYLSDKVSDEIAIEYDVLWKRENNTVFLGGANVKNMYLHLLSPDMGRLVTGNDESNILEFRFATSVLLSELEKYCLKPITNNNNDVCSAFENMFSSIDSFNASIVFYNDTLFIIDESGTNTTFIVNLKTGVVTPLVVKDGFAYKGATVNRNCGTCNINFVVKNIVQFVNNGMRDIINNGNDILSYIRNNIYPLTKLSVDGAILTKGVFGVVLGGTSAVFISLLATAKAIQSIGVYYSENFVDDEDLHGTYDLLTFTRPGPFQNVKIFNIPQTDGSVDYIRIQINSNGSLNRDNATYISEGRVKKLTRAETYNYFSEENWTPFNVPRQYWNW